MEVFSSIHRGGSMRMFALKEKAEFLAAYRPGSYFALFDGQAVEFLRAYPFTIYDRYTLQQIRHLKEEAVE